jgi:nucleoside-diphosphate-sugar epimerase
MYGGDILIDVSDYDSSKPLAQFLKLKQIEKYDGIVHLAALSGIFACEENYLDAIEKNLLTANNIFSKASMRGIPVVFTSSQAAKEPFSSKYANLKNQCEMLAELYNNTGGKNYVIRLANVYGGDQYLIKKQTCVKQFITKYREGNQLEVHGNGKQKRDFIHVLDVCNAIMLLLEKKPLDKSPMDIGTGIGTSIMDLAKMFPKKENHHYKFIDNRNTGTDSSIADISVAKERIGFKAERKLEDYIRSMI